jgi:tRNA A37 threonylcarbamoyladenosine biosynthesis protein TsaE
VDLYRLNANEIRALGLEEYWQNLNHVIAIEWADKALEFLPEQTLYIQFDVLKGNQRRITFLGHSHWKKILKSLKKF